MAKRCINAAGLAIVKQFEGLRLTAYRDLAGIWTIGYGHTGGVYKGEVVTQWDADWMLAQDLSGFEDWVDARTQYWNPTSNLPDSANRFSAMVSLSFNIGEEGFLGSSVRRLHNEGAFQAAADAFLLWDRAHVDGKLVVVQGLLDRRIAERALYLVTV